jgi:Putative metallopeptidase
MKPTGLMLALLLLLPAAAGPAAASDEPRTQRIKIDMQPVKTPDHQAVYDLVKQRQWLEKFQEFFGVFKLPDDITIRMMGCDGVSNAWYVNAVVTICYEYVEDIRKNMPATTTAQGITPADAVIGQFVYTASH